MADKRRRDMWASIPWQRRAAIVRKAKRQPPGRDRTIVLLAFQDGLSTAEIAELAKNRDDLMSRNHRPISARQVLKVIAQAVPDYNAYQKKHAAEHPRKDHCAFIWRNRGRKVKCANCGSTESLEWHHMIPQFLGGTAEPENMVCLCRGCHEAVTAYQQRVFPEAFEKQKTDAQG